MKTMAVVLGFLAVFSGIAFVVSAPLWAVAGVAALFFGVWSERIFRDLEHR